MRSEKEIRDVIDCLECICDGAEALGDLNAAFKANMILSTMRWVVLESSLFDRFVAEARAATQAYRRAESAKRN
jgi:hypothetical protein